MSGDGMGPGAKAPPEDDEVESLEQPGVVVLEETSERLDTQANYAALVEDALASSSDAEPAEEVYDLESDTAAGIADEEDGVEVEVDDDVNADVVEDAGDLAANEALLARIEELQKALSEAHQEATEARQAAEAAETEKQQNWDRLVRSKADLENYRKRSKRDLDDGKRDAQGKVLKEILPVIDNLERAVEHAKQAVSEDDPTLKGVTLVLKQFAQTLEKFDVRPVPAEGMPFDPNVHEAVSQVESDSHEAGTVVDVYQRGYTIGERLLRASMVTVAKPKTAAPSAPAAETPCEQEGETSEQEGETSNLSGGHAESPTPGAPEATNEEPSGQ